MKNLEKKLLQVSNNLAFTELQLIVSKCSLQKIREIELKLIELRKSLEVK